ncbi:MAG: Txe/YoeB family addiction module toxin [Actinomycetales bacterium]
MKGVFSDDGWADYLWWQQQDRKVLKRINLLIEDAARNGNEGIGKPDPLKHGFQGYWSRRINDEHRLVYKVLDDEVRGLRVVAATMARERKIRAAHPIADNVHYVKSTGRRPPRSSRTGSPAAVATPAPWTSSPANAAAGRGGRWKRRRRRQPGQSPLWESGDRSTPQRYVRDAISLARYRRLSLWSRS